MIPSILCYVLPSVGLLGSTTLQFWNQIYAFGTTNAKFTDVKDLQLLNNLTLDAHLSETVGSNLKCSKWPFGIVRIATLCLRQSPHDICFLTTPINHKLIVEQCCPTFLTPRAAQDIIMKPRAAPVNSKVTTKICWILIYGICVIVIFWNQRLSIMYAHCTRYFWQIFPILCHKLSQILDPIPLSM